VRSLQRRYVEEGVTAPVLKGRGRPSNNRISPELREKAIGLLKSD
jgi:hypothetical protein